MMYVHINCIFGKSWRVGWLMCVILFNRWCLCVAENRVVVRILCVSFWCCALCVGV